jgi:ABC-type Na+ efflux pump permease subunit
MEFKELCTPAKIYLVLAVLACIIALYHHVDIIAVLIKLIFAFIWTYILSWLCKKGLSKVAWFLVLLPYILIVLALLEIIRM